VRGLPPAPSVYSDMMLLAVTSGSAFAPPTPVSVTRPLRNIKVEAYSWNDASNGATGGSGQGRFEFGPDSQTNSPGSNRALERIRKARGGQAQAGRQNPRQSSNTYGQSAFSFSSDSQLLVENKRPGGQARPARDPRVDEANARSVASDSAAPPTALVESQAGKDKGDDEAVPTATNALPAAVVQENTVLLERNAALQEENKAMAADLAAFSPEFFEDIEELKLAYLAARDQLARYEQAFGPLPNA